MAKMTIDIVVTSDGQVQTDVVDGHQGTRCVEVLSGLATFLGSPSDSHLKVEFEADEEAQMLMRQMGVLT